MNEQKKKEPKEPLTIPLDFEQTLADMLKVKPPPDRIRRIRGNSQKPETHSGNGGRGN